MDPFFVPIALAPGVPPEAGDKPLFLEVGEKDGVSGTTTGKSAAQAFNFKKALSGAKSSQESSACTTRGDGAFEGGSHFKQRGNMVYLGPDALTQQNAEKTLAQLDTLTTRSGGGGGSSSPSPQQQPVTSVSKPGPPPSHIMEQAGSVESMKSLFEATHPAAQSKLRYVAPSGGAASLLYDLADDDGGGSHSRHLQTPTHSISEVQKDTQQCLLLSVDLPLLATAADVVVESTSRTVDISVPELYRLHIDLPVAVRDTEAHVKWSKARRCLSITLPKLAPP